MPALQFLSELPSLMAEVLAAPRQVVTVGVKLETTGWEMEFHAHQKAQLLLSLTGVGTCEAEGGIWLLPPGSALFVPGGLEHRVAAAGRIEGYAVFIEPTAAQALPARCGILLVNPLLRELIIRCAQFPASYPPRGKESRVAALLLEEVCAAPVGGLHLPMPTHQRLRALFQDLLGNPADRSPVEALARRAGFSERTLARVIAAETGLSFGRWRQQLNLILALQWLATGATVQRVALDLGYGSVGSFITMFRKALGASPARYMAERTGSH